MKRYIPILISIIMLISSMGSIATKINNVEKENEKTIKNFFEIKYSLPDIYEKENGYVQLSIQEEESYLMNPGQPMLPMVVRQVELPFGVKNIIVKVSPDEIFEQTISKQIIPASAPVSLSNNNVIKLPANKDSLVYSSSDPFPDNWYSYRVGCGLNKEGIQVTYLSLNVFPVRYTPNLNKLYFANNLKITITYDKSENSISFPDTNDLVIIAPSIFRNNLQELVDHKESHGLKTIIKTTEDIYNEFNGRDKPEQIKYFIKNAIEQMGTKYILLVGGLKSQIYANPREHTNYGAKGWHVPVRYSNLDFDEPGYLCDLYYADIYKYDNESGYIFDDWDSNLNGIFAEYDEQNKDDLDLYPDVALGRLACINNAEVKTVVDKIIKYENSANPSWFNRMIAISGDGFLDQVDLNINWDTKNLADGKYAIHAQSSNPEGDFGTIDVINITLDKSKETIITFNHDDHLNPALDNGYPALPIAEIVSVSEGNTLGNTDYTFTPPSGQAYCNDLFWWANISYINGVLTIRGKSYDPKPYGNVSHIKVWITNELDEIVFTDYRNNTETYYEGEWVTGGKELNGRGGALYYMSSDFEKDLIWTSNGKFSGIQSVIDAFSKGYGLAYFSGHGSPGWWGDHFPGIPGNRGHGQVAGLVVSQLSTSFPFFEYPVLPMDKLKNTDKPSVVVVGGCHNSMFSVSLIPSVLDLFIMRYFGKNIFMHTYGRPTPECWAWYLIKLKNTGAIATIGNTGFGWGSEGEWCTIGVGDGWIGTEFFKQYGQNNLEILGDAYRETLNSYITHHHSFTLPQWNDFGWDIVDEKTLQQWILLGDPSLKMGGYS